MIGLWSKGRNTIYIHVSLLHTYVLVYHTYMQVYCDAEELHYHVEGLPQPVVEWRFNDRTVEQGEKYYIHTCKSSAHIFYLHVSATCIHVSPL